MQKEWGKHHKEVQTKIAHTSSIIPAQRTAFKQGYSFSTSDFDTQLSTWNYIWRSAFSFHERLHAFLFLDQYLQQPGTQEAIWATSVKWQEQVNDWPLCDALSKINKKLLEVLPNKVYTQLTEWNNSKDLWKRRQSLVSLLYYSRTKKIYLPFKKIAALVTPLLTDKEYYVQKGIGWTLREMGNVYPADTLTYLQKNIKNISPIAFTAAVEKMDDNTKDELKAMRKKSK